MDSLCRMVYEGKRYNGFPQEEVGAEGAKKLAINVFKNGILSRGVLLEKTAGLKVTAGARRPLASDGRSCFPRCRSR